MAAKYERIANDLRQQIRSQQLAPGEQMPAQIELAERYRVSLPTIQQALGVLQAEGLIDAVHGIGTYVRAPQAAHPPDAGPLSVGEGQGAAAVR